MRSAKLANARVCATSARDALQSLQRCPISRRVAVCRCGQNLRENTAPRASAHVRCWSRSPKRSAAQSDAAPCLEARVAEHLELRARARTLGVDATSIRRARIAFTFERDATPVRSRNVHTVCVGAHERWMQACESFARTHWHEIETLATTRAACAACIAFAAWPRSARTRCMPGSTRRAIDAAPARAWRQRGKRLPGPATCSHAHCAQRSAASRCRRKPLACSGSVVRHSDLIAGERPHRARHLRGRRQRGLDRIAPRAAARARPGIARELDRGIVAGGERVGRQRVPVRAVIGRDREQSAQPVAIGERRLQAMARVLAHQVALAFVAQAPIGRAASRRCR